MGSSTDAHCFACGYDTFLMIGGGMANWTTYAAWPVSCNTCKAVTTANFKELPLICEECGSHDVISPTDLQWWKGDSDVIQSWNLMSGNGLMLTNGHYRCSNCGQFELRFGTEAGGHGMVLWD